MDDDLDLLHDPDGDGKPASRPWPLLAAVVIVALLSVAGLGWLASSLVGGDAEIRPAAAPSPTSSVPAPTTAPAPVNTTASPTASDAQTVAAPSPTLRTTRAPAPPPRTVVPTTPAAAPTTRKPTATPPPPAPKRVVIPDVLGERLKSATATLQAAGFRVAVFGSPGPPPRPDQRRVTSQRPGSGTLAPAGSTVVLVMDSV